MNKKSFFDLTPLLDVILILLFAILINGQFERAEAEAVYADKLEQLEAAHAETIGSMSHELLTLRQRIESLESADDFEWSAGDIKKYEALRGLVRVVELRLETRENQLLIDGNRTGFFLLFDELATAEQRATQRDRLKTLIMERLGRESGLVLMTLSEDGEVFRYAYQLVHGVLLELVQTVGPERIYYLEIK